MAHRGRYYPFAFRRDLTVHDFENQFKFPKYWVWVQDTLAGGDATTANRFGKISDACLNPGDGGVLTWHWRFRGVVFPYDCTLKIEIINPKGEYHISILMEDMTPLGCKAFIDFPLGTVFNYGGPGGQISFLLPPAIPPQPTCPVLWNWFWVGFPPLGIILESADWATLRNAGYTAESMNERA